MNKNTEKLQIASKLFMAAEIAKFSKKEHEHYEDSLKYYRDLKNSLDTAKEEGLIEGRVEGEQIGMQKGEQIGMQKGEQIGMQKVALNMIKKGMSIKDISELTGFTEKEISEM